MIKIRIFYLILLVTMLLFSCSEDFEDTKEDKLNELNFNAQLKNGRLCFPSKKSFQDFYYKNQEIDEDKLYELLEPFYKQGFLSLRPPMTDKNLDEIERQLKVRINNIQFSKNSSNSTNSFDEDYYADILDELEEIITCDVFSAFLNDGGEILIEDKIYKYTDVGLFYVNEDSYNSLLTFINTKEISNDPLIRTSETNSLSFFNEYPITDDMPITIESSIEYYRSKSLSFESQPINVGDIPSHFDNSHFPINSGGSSNSTPANSTPYVPLQGFENFKDNLQPCNSNGGFLGSLFGVNRICYDRWENNRRVRTKVWRHNYLVVYTLGTKVKNQRRQCVLFCWWYKTSNGATEIVKADEAIQFEYNFQHIYAPHQLQQIALSTNQNTVTYNRFNIEYKVNTDLYLTPWGNHSYTYISSQTYPVSNYFKIIRDDLVIFGYGNNNIVNQAYASLNSTLAANNLNKLFWKQVWNTSKKQLTSLRNEQSHSMPSSITMVSQHPEFGKVIIQKGRLEYALNSSNIEKVFDWGATLSLSLSNTGGINIGPGNHLLYPQNVRFNVIGAAKVNGVWRGSKLIYNF